MKPFDRRCLMTLRSCSSFPAKRVSVYPVRSWILWFLPGSETWVVTGVPVLGVREGVLLPPPLMRAGAVIGSSRLVSSSVEEVLSKTAKRDLKGGRFVRLQSCRGYC
jgi:hypothetical protein